MGGRIVAAVEAGTEKIAVLIGEIHGPGSLNIITEVSRPSAGIRKGQIIHYRQASAAVEEALSFAEVEVGSQIDTVYLAQTGGHVEGLFQAGTARVSGEGGSVTAEDIVRAVEEAKRRRLPENRVFIHHIRNPYRLDGRVVEDPEGLRGEDLEVGYWSVHGDSRRVSDAIHIVNGFGLNVSDVILSSVASASVVASEEQREGGCLVLDIGAGCTDYLLYYGGYIVHTGVVAVGGDHLVNDLSIGLRLNMKRARELLLDLGRAMAFPDDKAELIRIYGDNQIGDRSISRNGIDRILEVRLREVFGIIARRLEGVLDSSRLPGGVLLTGGLSRLDRIADLAADTFRCEAAVATMPDWVDKSLRGPEFSTVLGVLHYALTGESEDAVGGGRKNRRLLKRIFKF